MALGFTRRRINRLLAGGFHEIHRGVYAPDAPRGAEGRSAYRPGHVSEHRTPYVCVIEAHIHVPDSGSLKSKRKVVRSLRDGMRKRFGVAVSEIDGHDTWQRSTLLVAITGLEETVGRAEEVERYIAGRCPQGTSFERHLRSLEDLRG
ncbi:MAG: DUF503 domain-containing protein [Solirubrobacterales bacterium]